jgi:hypothetical protein
MRSGLKYFILFGDHAFLSEKLGIGSVFLRYAIEVRS